MTKNKRGTEQSATEFLDQAVRFIGYFLDLAEEGHFDCRVLSLDEFIAAEDKESWAVDRLLGPLGLPHAHDLFAGTSNLNSTANVFGDKRREQLNLEEQAVFDNHVLAQEALARLSKLCSASIAFS